MEQVRSACYITNSIQQIISLVSSVCSTPAPHRGDAVSVPGPVRVRFVVDQVTREQVVFQELKCSHIKVTNYIAALEVILHVPVTVT